MSLAILLVYSWLLDYRVNQLLHFLFLRRLPNDFSVFISYFSRSNAHRARKNSKTTLWQLTVIDNDCFYKYLWKNVNLRIFSTCLCLCIFYIRDFISLPVQRFYERHKDKETQFCVCYGSNGVYFCKSESIRFCDTLRCSFKDSLLYAINCHYVCYSAKFTSAKFYTR